MTANCRMRSSEKLYSVAALETERADLCALLSARVCSMFRCLARWLCLALHCCCCCHAPVEARGYRLQSIESLGSCTQVAAADLCACCATLLLVYD